MPTRVSDPVTATSAPRPRAVRGAILRVAVPVVLAAGLLLPDLVGLDRWLPFAVFVALRPVLTALTVVGVAAALLWRRRRAAPRRTSGLLGLVGVAAVAVVAATLVVPRAVPDPAPPPGGTELTVLELNVYEGGADVATVAAIIDRAHPDLVVLPEAGERFRRALAARVPSYRSWTNVGPAAPDVRGIVVLASPRAGAVTAERVDGDTRYPWAELTGGILGPTRLAAVHLVSVVPEWISYWPGELAMLQRWCGPDAGSTMIVGDFNATADHSGFRSGTAGCTDAATARGESLTATWPTDLPRAAGAQIDHVLTRDGPAARSVEVVDVPRSDHRGLLVHLRL